MSNSIRIKRRASGGGNAAGAPSSLKNGELAYNEVDDILYYGKGVSGSNAATIPGIAGSGAYVTKSTAQTIAGVKTLSALLNANAGIAVDTNKFTVADGSGNTVIAGTLSVGGGGLTVSNTGSVTSGTWAATDVAVAHGGTGASTAGAARTNLDVDQAGTDNSTNVTLAGSSKDYITLSGQELTVNQIDLTDDVTGALPAANVGDLPASKITSGTVASARLPEATATAKGAIELFSNTAQSVSANSVTATASRTYGIQLNSAGQAVVNVPWVNTTIANTFRPVQADGSAIGASETLNLIGGTNVTLSESNGAITIASTATATKASLGLDTDDDVVFRNLELGSGETSATLKGPATLTIDPSAHGDNTGKVVIAGDLQVDGTTTTVNSTTVEIDDLAIELAHDATTSALINGAGLRFGTNSSGEAVHSFQYVHADTRMVLTPGLLVSGGLQNTALTSCGIDGGTF